MKTFSQKERDILCVNTNQNCYLWRFFLSADLSFVNSGYLLFYANWPHANHCFRQKMEKKVTCSLIIIGYFVMLESVERKREANLFLGLKLTVCGI